MENREVLIAKEGNVFIRKEGNVYYGDVLYLGDKLTVDGHSVPETADDYIEVEAPVEFQMGALYE